jgi:hypothetical protein
MLGLMAEIALIACTKSKADDVLPAALLYRSPLFRKSLLYALGKTDRVYILSAKHGVLQLADSIEPYELSIKRLSATEKKAWVTKVSDQLTKLISAVDKVHILAGLEYTAPLLPIFQSIGCRIISPLAGKSLGQRISWLRVNNREPELLSQFSSFYSSIRELYIGQNGGRILGECTGKMLWPERGVYFLLEPDEKLDNKKFRPLVYRIVRIGTHAVSAGSKATLWNRISTHRGVVAGTGNHRSSIFRLHVGAALIRKSPDAWPIPSWGIGQAAGREIQERERPLEQAVSQAMGRMRLLWLDVPDEPSPHSDRSYIERNSIGLLSRAALLHNPQSPVWLGKWSPQIRIALSGLWNLDHLYGIPDADFTSILTKYVDITLGKMKAPRGSLAPVAWYRKQLPPDSPQLSLFAHDSGTPPQDAK